MYAQNTFTPHRLAIPLGEDWVIQPKIYPNREAALAAARGYVGPVLVEPTDSARLPGFVAGVGSQEGDDEFLRSVSGLFLDGPIKQRLQRLALSWAGPNFADAYEGARQDLLLWKRRAQQSEARLCRIAGVTTNWLSDHGNLVRLFRAESALTEIIEILDSSEIDFKKQHLANQALRKVKDMMMAFIHGYPVFDKSMQEALAAIDAALSTDSREEGNEPAETPVA